MCGQVLVVDDNPAVRTTLAALLEDEGYHVRVAEGSCAALRQIDALRPALILLDMSLPQADGRCFDRLIAQRGRCPDVPIIAMTMSGREAAFASEIGLRQVMEKPFSLETLLAQVQHCIGAWAAAPATPLRPSAAPAPRRPSRG